MRRRLAFAAIALFALLASGAAAAAGRCQAESEPESTVFAAEAAGGWCLAGSAKPDDQDVVRWMLDAAASGLWTLRMESLPGQVGGVLIARSEDGGAPRKIWSGEIDRATGGIVSPPLFLTEGNYVVIAAAAGGPVAYRLRLSPVPMPPDLPAAGKVAGAFAVTVHAAGYEVSLPWWLDAAAPGTVWTLAAQGPPGRMPTLTLHHANDTVLMLSGAADAAGVVRLPDLALAPGPYRVALTGVQEGMPLIVSATTDSRADTFATEPDSEFAKARPLALGQPATGRLLTAGAGEEHDVFVVTIPDDGARLVEASASAPGRASLALAILDAQGNVVFQRRSTGAVSLRGLALSPGMHFLQLTGVLPPDVLYTLRVDETGVPMSGAEIEPNDVPAMATFLPGQGQGMLSGRFDKAEDDYVDLGVSDTLQLWDIEASGEGLQWLGLHDGRNAQTAAGYAAGNPLIRLSRLLLPPGRNLVRLGGQHGGWLLRAQAVGPPVPGEEIEPNDSEADAIALVPGRTQIGWLDHSGDQDLYTFHLAAEHHVAIGLTGPAELPIQMNIGWGGLASRLALTTTTGGAGQPQDLFWDGLLPPGDYMLSLGTSAGISRDPYRLTLELKSYFERPVDLEPNNEAWQARALPASGLLDGRLDGHDVDWFRLPGGLAAGTLEVGADALPPQGLALQLARLGTAGPEPAGDGTLAAAGQSASFSLPGGGDFALRITANGGGAYALTLSGPVATAPAATQPVQASLALDGGPVAAFETRAQRLAATVSVRNTSNAALSFHTASWTGDARWSVTGLPTTLDVLAAGTITVPVAIEIPPDAYDVPIDVEIALLSDGAKPATARATVEATADAAAILPHRSAPLPEALLGGLNVAWSALGGTSDPAMAALIDGLVDTNGVVLDPAAPPVFDLSGEAAVPLAGVLLYQAPGATPLDRLSDFAVEATADGALFTRVLQARASSQPREQAFVFGEPVSARGVRLVPLSRHGGPVPGGRIVLSEFKVVAQPAFALAGDAVDVAQPALGGHLIRHVGFGPYQALTGQDAVWPSDRVVYAPADRTGAPEWVFGFLNGRAARIAHLAWHAHGDVAPERLMRAVEVDASLEGPLGPWTALGLWQVHADNSGPAVLTPPAPPWARAVRFRLVDPAGGEVALPQRIEVIEQSGGTTILGEWGDMGRDGPYEATLPAPPPPSMLPPVGHDAQSATPLALDTLARGRVHRGVSEDWYRLELPEGTQSMRVDFAGDLAPEVAVVLADAGGREIPLVPDADSPGTMTAPASPGTWTLRVHQPPQSIVASWDTSASVSNFIGSITRVVQRLTWELRSDREQINLVPFRGPSSSLLMESWSGDPAVVYGALHAYPWADGSSDAESALNAAVHALERRVGSRAVVIITDANFGGVFLNEMLWESLGRSRTKVFALHLPIEYDPVRARAQANLMLDWSQAAGGYYTRFASQGDAEAAFRRMSAWLRRPAVYAFTVAADTAPPPPGQLIVEMRSEAAGDGRAGAASGAVEIVLDASGSMLQRLDGVRRIEIARQALAELADAGLPPGTQLALRVFGQGGAGSCASDLVLPPEPFNAAAFNAAIAPIQPVNRAKTPIGDSLRLAGADLAGLAGRKLIVLVTDGEETCGGDPAGEIAALRAAGLDARVNIVGFAVDDPALKETFAAWAATGGGGYFDAGDAVALSEALQQAVTTPFDILGADGSVVASGIVGGPAIELPPGDYTISIGGKDEPIRATITSGGTTTVAIATTGGEAIP